MTSKQRFVDETSDLTNAVGLVVAVQMPTGAVEIITNSTHLEDKVSYYKTAYNEDFELKTFTKIKIVGYLVVRRRD